MRTFYALLFLFLLLQCFVSCQKELSFSNPSLAGNDSITLIKTIKSINYDENDVFDWSTLQTFMYDSINNRTVVSLVDSGINIYGTVQQYTETFQYDAQKRLVRYTSTGISEPAAQIDFSYNAAGDIVKTVMQDRWVGNTIVCNYKTVTTNGQKMITVYDTSGVYNPNYGGSGDTRPEICRHTFDDSSRLINETLYYTYYRRPQNLFEDTLTTSLFYNNKNFIYKTTDRDSYHPSDNNPPPVVSTDSALYTSEGSATALRNSFFYVYRNMYWLNISEFSSGFAEAINKSGLQPYTGSPVKTGEYWSFDDPDPVATDHQLGLFQNTFDASGVLLESVYPKKFANKYGGKTETSYTYAKIRK